MIGSPAYMSPEQATGDAISPRTDLYAVGAMTYELLLGRIPFDGASPLEIIGQHVHAPLPSPLKLAPDIDPRLARWLEWLLEKDPKNRPEDAEQAWEVLDEIVVDLLGSGWRRRSRLAGDPAETPRPEKRSPPRVSRAATPQRTDPPLPRYPSGLPPNAEIEVRGASAAEEPDSEVPNAALTPAESKIGAVAPALPPEAGPDELTPEEPASSATPASAQTDPALAPTAPARTDHVEPHVAHDETPEATAPSVRTRRPPKRLLFLSGLALVAIAAAVVGGLKLRHHEPSASSDSGKAVLDAVRGNTDQPFPTAAERSLLAAVPRRVRSTCSRDETAETSSDAALVCFPRQIISVIFYAHYTSPAALRAAYGAPSPDKCAGLIALEGPYRVGGQVAGHLACESGAGYTFFTWTDTASQVLAEASAKGKPLASFIKLYGWWKALFPLPPKPSPFKR
jgi:hypothetical protein